MANYYASARSNYFRVKDISAFKADCPVPVEVQNKDGKDYCVILFEEEGILTWGHNGEEINWAGLFAKHLQEDSVAIFMEAGAEKLCYICGYAVAYNASGDELRVCLDDIYALVRKEWSNNLEVTAAEY